MMDETNLLHYLQIRRVRILSHIPTQVVRPHGPSHAVKIQGFEQS